MAARYSLAKPSRVAAVAVSRVPNLITSLAANHAPAETATAVAVETTVVVIAMLAVAVDAIATTTRSALAARLAWIRLKLFFRQ